MTISESFIEKNGRMFKVERAGTVVAELKGRMQNGGIKSQKYIGFFLNSDIIQNDWIIDEYGDRFFVIDVMTGQGIGGASELEAYYETESEHSQREHSSAAIFNIQNASGSIIGTQAYATLNYNYSIGQLSDQIEKSNSDDKEELKQIVDLLEKIVNNQISPSKGMLSKFSSVLERNSWITSPIASILLNWLIFAIH